MRKPSFKPVLYDALVWGLALLFSACSWNVRDTLSRTNLFSISLGTLPHQLDWFYRDGFRIASTTDIQYQDGRAYISAYDAGKVMIFSSYGELLTLIYDPKRNSEPRFDGTGKNKFSLFQWSLNKPFAIAIQDNIILVEDTVDSSRRVLNKEQKGWDDKIVLRFDFNGRYVEHLGREGIGGSPFPPIWSVDVRQDKGIVVTTVLNRVWRIFWYNKEGNLITTLVMQESQLPDFVPETTVYSIRPDPVDLVVYIRADRYIQVGNSYQPEALLYTLDMNTLKYSEPLELRFSDGDDESGFPPVPPEHLGVTPAGQHVLLSPEGSEKYRLSLVDSQGRVKQHRSISVDSDATVYRRFRLNNEGILVGMFFSDSKADVSIWRLDKLDS